MIADGTQKVKDWYLSRKNDLFTASIIFLVGLGGFGLGRLSVIWIPKEPIIMTQDPDIPVEQSVTPASVVGAVGGKYVGSRSGNSYHLPTCAGALKIKEENKIWFQSKEEAESRGYKPAGNCPGI